MINKNIILSGVIVRGLGEGTYFMSMQHYQKEIKKRLGFNAYPGTLNLKLEKKQRDIFKNLTPIKIDGFKSNNKKFGGANCYRAKIKNTNGSIIVPDLTKHNKDVIEFIAPVHLKSKLKFKNGDKIKVELVQ
ncbi:CTP-dependent riboflavin kinase [Candidatus Woesearchaeota archaeon]|nr:CTP-dependent riboflavin kinase [Candidatus Woesearchaeota archaeon]